MNMVWLNGWGLSSRYVERIARELYPDSLHSVISPVSTWVEDLSGQGSGQVLVGYSLGAFLLLSRPEIGARFRRVALLAPFHDFRAEAGRGGRVRKAKLAYLLRWLSRNRMEGLRDFWSRAELENPENPNELRTSDLEWGIQRLLKSSAHESAGNGIQAYVGDQDTLLDAEELKHRFKKFTVVSGAGHDLKPLARAAKLAE